MRPLLARLVVPPLLILALFGLLTRGIGAPMDVGATGGVAKAVAVSMGAAICHADEAPGLPQPGTAGHCDSCLLCQAHGGSAALPSGHATILTAGFVAPGLACVGSAAPAYAAAGFAEHRPRGPPAV
jgi:hypothetical protein